MIHHDEDVNKDHDDDRLIEHYDTILKESALLATFAGILFGFLLQISINTPKYFTSFDKAILLVALFSITIAASLFAMPVIYHHLQYPYRNLEKFKVRSHRFTILGLIHSGITLYLGIEIALGSVLNTVTAFALAAIPFIIVYIYFRERRLRDND
ncbi:MAG TPA: DUF6328 family protein [Bacteroidia bacterium]|jgi:Family of unknown function (DUF6328)|nr:DUF6328 family protein [Bacteroidia bacterium]